MRSEHFKAGMYKWSGKTVKCEDLTVQLTEVLSERYADPLGEYVVVADGQLQGDSKLQEADSSVVVRMRVQLDLEKTDKSNQYMALRTAAIEHVAMQDLVDSRHTPRCLAFSKMLQDQSWPYLGGYVHVLVMSKVPGRNVQEVLFDLNEEERAIIRHQLTNLLEYMRLRGWSYYDPKPSNLVWDRETSRVYLVDLEAVEVEEKGAGDIITPESDIVELFGVWNKYAYRDEKPAL